MAGDDRELIDALRTGDEAGSARLVAMHQPGFVRVAQGVFAPDSLVGGFLMTDVPLLGAALLTAAEALDAAALNRRAG